MEAAVFRDRDSNEALLSILQEKFIPEERNHTCFFSGILQT